MSDVTWWREYTFYVAARNKYNFAISGLNTIKIWCPATGGATITPPAASLSREVLRYATSTAAYLPFAAWTSTDIIRGCGTFLRYDITGTAAVTQYL